MGQAAIRLALCKGNVKSFTTFGNNYLINPVIININIQMLKKKGHLFAILKNLNSFVANNRHTVHFNKQFVDLTTTNTGIK